MSVDVLRRKARHHRRSGSVAPLLALLMIPMVAMVAFSVDYGYLCKVKCDMQRSADAAALACLQDLVPAADGTQDLNAVRATLRNYVAVNSDGPFQVLDADIEIGRYDPATIYSPTVTLLNSGIFDAVRVRLRRDASANSPVRLFLAPVLGIQEAPITVTATAILQKPFSLIPGSDILPFSVPLSVWDSRDSGEEWSIYGDGKIYDDFGAEIPGNWGTLDIGSTNNSTADLNDQILNGLRQADLDALYADGRIQTNTHIDADYSILLQADTGLSSGLKNSVQQIHGQTRIVPIYSTSNGEPGNNLEYTVVKWGVVEVVDSEWNGAKNTHVTISKSYDYHGFLSPNPDLSDTTWHVEGAFTSPVLVE